MKWDPQSYEAFADQRMRPFLDLMARVPRPAKGARIVDAGCGTGRTTALLAHWFPDAHVLGVDASMEMLQQVPDGIPTACADLAAWETKADLVVCNAVLHWIAGPEAMLRRLASWTPTLAVQVPANHDAPSHVAVRDVAESYGLEGNGHVLPLRDMLAVLQDEGRTVDAWETTYLHQLGSPEAILDWLAGTTLRPYLAALDEAKPFLDDVLAKLRQAYPDGLYPFTRRFVVAVA